VNHEPSNGFYRFWLADLLEHIGEIDEALQEMEIATLLNPEDDYYHFRFGLLCIENEEFAPRGGVLPAGVGD
jgi:hypothetical protein